MARFSELRMRQAEERFRARAAIRGSQLKKLESLGQGVSWWDIEEPARVVERLNQLRRSGAAGEALVVGNGGPPGRGPDLLERIINADDLIPVRFLAGGAERSRAVGRVAIRTHLGALVGFGTGFMVSPRLLMTNHHVLSAASEAVASRIQFDFVETETGSLLPLVEFALNPSKFFLAQQDLDFALVAVEPRNSTGALVASRGFCRLIGGSGKALVGERVNIIQHPEGEPQQVALRDNTIVDVFENFLHYVSDTEQGSSGSPVYNDQWHLAALHHSSVPKRNAAGQILLRSGQVWDGSDLQLGDIAWVANEGVRISSIVARLKELAPNLPIAHQNLISEAIALGSSEPESMAQTLAAVQAPAPETTSGPTIDSAGNATWVVPIRVSIAVGGVDFPRTSQNAPDVGMPSSPPNTGPLPDSAGLQDALKQLQESESRVYFDAADDALAREAYYEGLDLNANAAELFRTLSSHLKSTHSRVLPYDAARNQYLYPWIDLRENPRVLRSVYSDRDLDPQEIIRQDFETLARRDALIRERVLSEGLRGEVDLEAFIDGLEAQMPFNCEHVVPQSWFNKKSPMRSDLHHLFTCEIACNSFRGNIPYFDFGPEAEVIRQHCGRLESGRFEPAAGKGAVARATLYFLLRYPGTIGDRQGEMPRDRVRTLLAWHRATPIDSWEKHRNAEIAKVQGNRNPLIDFPELAERIDFERGLGG